MLPKLIPVVAIALAACCLLTAQPPAPTGLFTAEQAQAGRALYERTCGQCHTPSLMGRKGAGSTELPPVSSLSESWQNFIGPRGWVPPLAGGEFLNRYGGKSVAQLIARFQETVDDPYLKFQGVDSAFTVNLTAYILQMNGAKPGTVSLTRETRPSVYEAIR